MLNIQIDNPDLEAYIKQDIEVSLNEIEQGDFKPAKAVFDSIRADYK